MKSELEEIVLNRIMFCGFGRPEREYRFHPVRKWRFDFAFPDKKVAIEAEGGSWSGGRHTRGSGFIKDSEKYNEAVCMGWRVLRYTTSTVGNIRQDLERVMNERMPDLSQAVHPEKAVAETL